MIHNKSYGRDLGPASTLFQVVCSSTWGIFFSQLAHTRWVSTHYRLPVPRTATSPFCLWSRSQNKINNFVKKSPLSRLRTSDEEVTMNTSSTLAKQADRGHVVMS